jgi:cell division protein FtsL
VAAAAQARRGAPAPRRDDEYQRWEAPPPAQRRAPRSRRRAVQRARLTRAFVAFVVCLSLLAVGRVALSFAVVQKTIETDSVAREQRALSAENAQLQEDLAQLGSTVRIRHIAEKQLGLVDAGYVQYLHVGAQASADRVAERP